MSLWDDFLRIGSTMDWISPAFAYLEDQVYGPGVDFTVPDNTGVSGRQIEAMLKEQGIQVWGLMAVGDELLFTVNKRQGNYARYWLERARLPYKGGPTGDGGWAPGPNAGWKQKKVSQDKTTLGDRIYRWLVG